MVRDKERTGGSFEFGGCLRILRCSRIDHGSMASTSAVQQVVQALNVLYQDPNPAAKETANAWLSDFQKSVRYSLTSSQLLADSFAPE